MIELVPLDGDDVAFVELAQWIVRGAVEALDARELYLVHVDNWFNHWWLGFWSQGDHGDLKRLYVPPFNPNRVQSEKHLVWDAIRCCWSSVVHTKPLHVRQPGRQTTFAQPLERRSKSAAFVWYSGNTIANGAGSLMMYLSGAEGYAWYASFTKVEHWKIENERRISRRELVSFENRGREIELTRM